MKLSRSKWENFIRCPFCFYLKEKHNIDPPRTPGHPINSRVDSLLKAEFDELRKNQQPHAIFKKYNLNFVPLNDPKLEDYRKNIDVLVDAYYNAFTNDDDVVLKIVQNKNLKEIEKSFLKY